MKINNKKLWDNWRLSRGRGLEWRCPAPAPGVPADRPLGQGEHTFPGTAGPS
jgi:hypothetical protein